MNIDREHYSAVAHTGLRFANPLSADAHVSLAAGLGLSPEAQVLDVGCGAAAFLDLVLDQYRCHALGVDLNPTFLQHAQVVASRHPGLTLCRAGVSALDIEPATEDLLICLGATHALGDLSATLRFGRRVLRRRGWMIVGDGIWERSPDPAYLAALGMTADQVRDLEGTRELVSSLGFGIVDQQLATLDDWDRYESSYHDSVLAWASSCPDPQQARAYRERADAWFDLFLAHGRGTLGFAAFKLRVLDSALA